MTTPPTVSVLLLSQNHAPFVAEAVRGVLGQTWTNWELTVVDNHSSDGSWPILQQIARGNPRMRVVRPCRKLGISEAMNFGLEPARGRYIAPMDSDDSWLPGRLERQVRFMEEPGNLQVGVLGSNCLLMDRDGRVFGAKDYPLTHEGCVKAFWYRNPVCHSASLIRRECFERFGGYDAEFDLVQDFELWLRFGQRYRLANLPERLTQVRISNSNASVRFHRDLVARTLRARRRAVAQYGYRPGASARAALAVTWCVQWLPARLVRHAFNQVFLRYGRFFTAQ